MKKMFALFLALYLALSCAFSIAHAMADNPWNFRTYRNGLLCVEITERDFVVYSPFCNWSDVYLFGVAWEETEQGMEWYTFGDGLHNFGEWFVWGEK